MDKQLTPAAELRVYYKAVTILAGMMAEQSYGDCPVPENFDPYVMCASPSKDLCGKCFRNYAISKATQEVITDKLEADICQSDVNVISDELRRIWLPHTERKVAESRAEAEAERDRLQKMVDWLAGQLHGTGEKYDDVICPQEKCHPVGDCIYCWKEAASRAVGG